MTFEEILDDAIAMLQRRRRVTYRALKLQFKLDDEQFAALKEEILYSQPHVVDDVGRGLIWTADTDTTPDFSPSPQLPALAEIQQGQPAQAAPAPAAPQTTDAERRQLTVMFCDLADFTKLSGQLDPEDLREVIRAYQEVSAGVIQHFDGHIAQYLGDGLLVYFGYPQAHEDDAQRAVRAGLGLLEAMQTLNVRLAHDTGIRVAVRLGIHTGLVVVGAVGGGGKQEQLAFGETPNIAARLQGLAAPGTLVISTATYQLVQGYFVCLELGIHTLKGVEQPIVIYQVLQESAAQSRLDVVAARGLTPLVGREEEVGLLLRRWAQSQDGLGQVVLLSGEAGIGKSRLVEVLREHAEREGYTRLAFRCSPYYQQSALYPIIEHTQRLLQFRKDDGPEAKLGKLEQALQGYRLALDEVVPLLAALLSVPLPEARYAPLPLSPQRQRQKTLEALLAWLVAEAERQPTLAVWEDLHWADPSTLEFLSLLIDQAPTVRLLTLLTCRPEFRSPWTPRSYYSHLTLGRLGHTQVEAMLERLTGGRALPAEVVQQVVARTDGVPLFVEELTKAILESDLLQEREDHYELLGPLPALAIPATLHDSLMARLDRLATSKEVAQLAATVGRTFPYELLRAVSPLDEALLQQALGRLVEAELLYQRGMPPQATYLFKHALIQETAYQSLLKSTRQQYHQRIVQVLEAQFPEVVETQPEILAYHYTEAGLSGQAVVYWQQAGQRAIARSANVEAVSHLTRGLEVLATLPDTPERTQRELGMHIALGPALTATRGWGATEVGHTYTQALELCRRMDETPQILPALRGVWAFYQVRAELQRARALGEQLLSLAQRVQDSAVLLEAHRALGGTLLYLGELTSAHARLEQGAALYHPLQHRSLAFLFGNDPGVACLCLAAVARWLLGYPDQSLKRSHEALTLAQGLTHPYSLAHALNLAAWLHQLRREGQIAQGLAEAAVTLSTEQGFAYYLAMGMILRGWALAEQGQAEAGVAQMRQGLSAWQAQGSELARPHFLALLAGAYGKGGQAAEGLHVLAEALTLGHKTEEHWWDAELYRLTGELLLVCSAENHTEAEAYFDQALALTRRQQAKSLELRAAMSLSRLWQQQGKRDAAHQLLAGVYGWFTEGFDTPDLQEAKALLEELS